MKRKAKASSLSFLISDSNNASSMNSIIIAMCMLFVIGVGVVDSRRFAKIVDNSKDDDDTEGGSASSAAKEGN